MFSAWLSRPTLLGALIFAGNSLASDFQFDAYLRLANDYIYRGMSYGDGRVSPEFGLTASHQQGVFAGVWVGRDDIAGLLGESQRRDIETEYQLGYQRLYGDHWSLRVSRAWHEYLKDNQPRNHDYQETRLQLGYRDRLGLFAAHAQDIWTTGLNASTLAVSYRIALPYKLLMEQEVGSMYFSRGSSSRGRDRRAVNLAFLRLSFGRSLTKNLSAQMDVHYSKASNNSLFNPDRIGNHLLISLNYFYQNP